MILPRQYVPRQYHWTTYVPVKRKHQEDEDTGLGPATDPLMLKLALKTL